MYNINSFIRTNRVIGNFIRNFITERCIEIIQITRLLIQTCFQNSLRSVLLCIICSHTSQSERQQTYETLKRRHVSLFRFVREISSIHYELTIVLNDNGQASSGQADKRFSRIKIYGTATSFSEFMGCKVEAHGRCMAANVWGSTENVSRGHAESVNRAGKKNEKHSSGEEGKDR